MDVRKQLAQPFTYDGSFDVFTYRIPCLLTLCDGDVMAVTDLRVNILDSPNNIEIGVRVLDSKTGEWGCFSPSQARQKETDWKNHRIP